MAENASSLQEEGSVTTSTTTCASCEKALHGKLLSCSKCRRTSYCTRDCQVKHWPMHKIRCQQMQNSKQDAIANNQKRLHKLIGEWMNKCRDIMVDSLLGYFGKEAMASMEPERNVVYIKVDFDYNHHTFVPTEPPIIAAVDDDNLVPDPYAVQIHRLYDEAKQHAPSNLPLDMQDVEFVPVISFIEHIGGHANDSDSSNDRQYMIHTNMVDLDEDDDDDDCEHEVSFEEMVNELKYNVALTSKKFPKWESLRKENMEKQIHAMQRDENFAPFVSHALQMFSSEPKNALHVVIMIHVKQGFGLGEISSLEKYSLVARKEVKKEVKKRGLKMVDLDPSRHRAIVVFNSGGGTSTDIYQVVLVENSPPTTTYNGGTTKLTVQESDEQANTAFAALCRIQLPSIQNPELH